MVETDADRAALLADFGVPVVATVGGVAQPAVVGIFDDAYFDVLPTGERVSSAKPTLLMRSIDCVNWKKSNTTVVVNGSTWRLSNPEPDGTGYTLVRLLVGP